MVSDAHLHTSETRVVHGQHETQHPFSINVEELKHVNVTEKARDEREGEER